MRHSMTLTCPTCKTVFEPNSASDRAAPRCPKCDASIDLNAVKTVIIGNAGAQIGRFEIIALVGRGTFGKVYKARDSKLNRIVALKVPDSEQISSPVVAERFLREARVVAGL